MHKPPQQLLEARSKTAEAAHPLPRCRWASGFEQCLRWRASPGFVPTRRIGACGAANAVNSVRDMVTDAGVASMPIRSTATFRRIIPSMLTNERPMLEICEQVTPVFGWVIVARWPAGPSEQLLGVYTSWESAEQWIVQYSEDWFAQQAKKIDIETSGCIAG
jgi:hypothetical protein